MSKATFIKEIFSNIIKGKLAAILYFTYYKRWKYYLQPGRNSIIDRMPWINFPAIDFLKKRLKSDDQVFEFGGGGSTLFFLDRVKKVVTVEHDREWFEILKRNLTESDHLKWHGNLIPADLNKQVGVLSSAMPNDYVSADVNLQQMQFKSYANYIEYFEDENFDVVLIDGRARPSCIKHSANKVKIGGLLILDNAERTYYLTHASYYLQNFKLILDKLAPIPFISHFVQTNIYKRIE